MIVGYLVALLGLGVLLWTLCLFVVPFIIVRSHYRRYGERGKQWSGSKESP